MTDLLRLAAWLARHPAPEIRRVMLVPASDTPAFALVPDAHYGCAGAYCLLVETSDTLTAAGAQFASALAASGVYLVSVTRGWEACARSIAGYLGVAGDLEPRETRDDVTPRAA